MREALAAALKISANIADISMENESIEGAAVQAQFSGFLRVSVKSSAPYHLAAPHCGEALADALKINISIKRVNLRYSRIGVAGAEARFCRNLQSHLEFATLAGSCGDIDSQQCNHASYPGPQRHWQCWGTGPRFLSSLTRHTLSVSLSLSPLFFSLRMRLSLSLSLNGLR